jgi:hypothetical protein
MDALWSREFLIALAGFLTPVTIATVFVYRCVLHSKLCRRQERVLVTQAKMLRVMGEAAPPAEDVRPPADTCPPAPRTLHTLEEPLANLRQCLVAFRTSIQESRSALGVLQECDSRFSLDLGRASQVMHHAFTK